MGGSSDQVVGYKYYCGLMVAIGNRIDKFIGFNADKRGWSLSHKKTNSSVEVNQPDLFGGDKQEGGFVGVIDVHLGADDQAQNYYLSQRMNSLVSAYPNLSYLVYRGLDSQRAFHLNSMSGAMKEVLYWVSRVNVKNNGDVQWLKPKAGILDISNKSGDDMTPPFSATIQITCDGHGTTATQSHDTNWDVSQVHQIAFSHRLSEGSGFYGESRWNDNGMGNMSALVKFVFDVKAIHKVKVTFVTVDYPPEPYSPNMNINVIGGEILSESGTSSGGAYNVHTHTFTFEGTELHAMIQVTPHVYHRIPGQETIGYTNRIGDINGYTYFPLMQSFDNSVYDINPIHKIREILTDDTAMNKPESSVNDVNFTAAANRIFDEALGISWAIQEKTCKEAIDELLYHIEAGVRVNRQTGKYEVILFRDDLLNLDTAMSFGKNNIKSFQPEVANADDLINVLNVSYYDRINIKSSAFSVYENGNIRTTNQEIAEDVRFPYFMNIRNAELVANWKLKQISTPTWKGSFTTGLYEARKLNRYDVVKLTWSELDIIDLPVRIMKINLGDGVDNTVSLDFIEVIPYSNIDYKTINVDVPTNQIVPPKANVGAVLEMPYYEAVQNFGQTQVDAELSNNPQIGYLLAAAKKPQNNSLNAMLYVDSGSGFAQRSILNYAPTLILDQNIGYLDTSFAVKDVDAIGEAAIGTCFIVDSEVMVYQAYDSATSILTVKRAALDTHPAMHNAETMAFFYDAFSAFDTTQYLDGEDLEAKILTTTPSGILSFQDAQTLSLEIKGRGIRPYPPNNIKINGEYYIAKTLVSSDVVVTWVDRNRLQQTGGSILGWVDGTITKEAGVTYSLELIDTDSGSLVHSAAGINATTYTIDKSLLHMNKIHKLKLWSVRDGFDSLLKFEHSFLIEAEEVTLTATAFKDRVEGGTLSVANVNVVVDESMTANMKWDGSQISGKAEPNATITIEVQD